MKTRILLLKTLLMMFISEMSSAQITFEKTYSVTGFDHGVSILQTADSGYIIAGYTGVGWKDSADVFVVRTDIYGDTLWTKTFGGAGNDYGYDVIQTLSGEFIITGVTKSFGAGGYDVYLIKLDMTGNLLWSKTYGGLGNEWANSVLQTNTGEYIVIGTTNTDSLVTSPQTYLIKTDMNGDTLWTKIFSGTIAATGCLTNDGGFIITGQVYDFVSGEYDACLIKTDSTGNILWTKAYGGTMNDYGNAVQQTNDGGYIVAGNTWSFGAGSMDVYLIKTNSSGDTLWSRTFGGSQYDYGTSVQQTSDGGYIVGGKSGNFSDYYLIKTDVNGDTLWTRRGGTNFEGGTSIQQSSDQGYIITSSGAAYDNLHLFKTDPFGNNGCNGTTGTLISNPITQITNKTIIVIPSNTIVTVPLTIVHSGSIINTICFTTGINEIPQNQLSQIFPNPFKGELILKETKPQGQIILFDITGKQILNQKTLDGETKINAEKLLPGFYLLNYTEGNTTANFKVIRE